jgi:outer membrane protein insertion porin family
LKRVARTFRFPPEKTTKSSAFEPFTSPVRSLLPATFLLLALLAGSLAVPLRADISRTDPSSFDPEGRIIHSIDLQPDGPLTRISVTDLRKLMEIAEGAPYTTSQARHTINRIYSTGLFHDIQILAGPAEGEQVSISILLVRRFFISRIEFAGKTELAVSELRRELAFRAGEAFSSELMEETLARLGEFYQSHGYYQARIQPRYEVEEETGGLRLVFEIAAGDQARVARLELDYEGPVDAARVRSLMQIREGGPFSRLQMQNDIQNLEIDFALRGYLHPDIYVRDGEQYDPATNSVSLSLRILPRLFTNVEFQGVRPSDDELRTLPLFTERGAPLAFLEETARQLRVQYQRRGYFLVEVDYTMTQRDTGSHIVIRLEPGRRYYLSDIVFEGNTAVRGDILQRLLEIREAGLFGRGLLTNPMLESDVGRLRSFYQQRGYLDTQVSYDFRTSNPNPNNLIVLFRIDEGERYFVEQVEIQGNERLDDATILREIQARPGMPFSPLLVAQDRSNLLAAYENRGYREADFRSEVAYNAPQQVKLVYHVQEGPQFFVEDVILTGNLRTRESVIRNQVRIRPGDPLSLDHVLQTETNLYDLAVFNRVQTTEVSSYRDPLQKTLIVSVEEARKYTLLYGAGYSSYEGPRGTFGISDINFLGGARALSLGARVGAQRQRGTLSYSIPRLFDTALPTILAFSADNEQAQTETTRGRRVLRGRPYDVLRFTASSQTERRLSIRESLFFRSRFENVQIGEPRVRIPLEFFREEDNLRLATLALSYLNESRDDPTNPRGGFFLTGETQLAHRILSSQRQFFRILAQGQYYRRVLFPDVVLASSLRIGAIVPFGRTADLPLENPIPISERFFSGGATTLRGLPQDLAGPLLRDAEGNVVLVNDQGIVLPDAESQEARPVPLGGNAMLIANTELRFPIFAFFSGALFFDTGNVFRSFTDLSNVGFSNAVGFGLRLNTPIGPVRFDVGHNPNPPNFPGYKNWNIHITLGHPF